MTAAKAGVSAGDSPPAAATQARAAARRDVDRWSACGRFVHQLFLTARRQLCSPKRAALLIDAFAALARVIGAAEAGSTEPDTPQRPGLSATAPPATRKLF